MFFRRGWTSDYALRQSDFEAYFERQGVRIASLD